MYPIDIIKIIAITVSGLIFITVLELIRRNHLKERYSLIWLAASIVLIIFSSWRGLLHFSTVISSQSDHNKRLAQEIGVLKSRLDRMEKGYASQNRDPSKD